jgi:hypothetical protein
MTIEQLRLLHQARPFRPFTIHLADGRQVHVPHNEFLSFSPSGRTIIVHQPDDSYSVSSTSCSSRNWRLTLLRSPTHLLRERAKTPARGYPLLASATISSEMLTFE